MSVDRLNHTATLLSGGRVLIAGGDGTRGPYASAELYDPKTSTFNSTGSMTIARFYATATLLPDGRVLIAGGSQDPQSGAPLASAEVYDPKTGEFSTTGSMSAARSNQTATLLPDGRILVVGGGESGRYSAELYDPKTGTFSATGSMTRGRVGHTATLLPDGRVLITGGTPPSASAELYDPKTGRFSRTGSMTTGRGGHTATLLPDGRVLIAGGGTQDAGAFGPLATAELYDPETGRFSPTGSMANPRLVGFTAAPLLDGRVLIAGGGGTGTDLDSAEVYDPKTGAFSSVGPMTKARVGFTATLLPDGRVLIAGGLYDANAELYRP